MCLQQSKCTLFPPLLLILPLLMLRLQLLIVNYYYYCYYYFCYLYHLDFDLLCTPKLLHLLPVPVLMFLLLTPRPAPLHVCYTLCLLLKQVTVTEHCCALSLSSSTSVPVTSCNLLIKYKILCRNSLNHRRRAVCFHSAVCSPSSRFFSFCQFTVTTVENKQYY